MMESQRIDHPNLLADGADIGLHKSELPEISELDPTWLDAARDAMNAAKRVEKPRELTPGELGSLKVGDIGNKVVTNLREPELLALEDEQQIAA